MAIVAGKNPSQKIFSVFNVILMILFMIVILYPILNMVSISVSDDVAVMIASYLIWEHGIRCCCFLHS